MNKFALVLYGYIVPGLWTTLLLLCFTGTGYKNFNLIDWIFFGVLSFMAYYLPYLVHTIYYKKR